jgi:hypothetical protein
VLINYFRASGTSHKMNCFRGLTHHFQILLVSTLVDLLWHKIQLKHELNRHFIFQVICSTLIMLLFC